MTIDARYHTTAEELATIWQAKLEAITKLGGYQTDIGLRVYRGRRQVLPENVPCIIVVEGDDRPESNDTPEGMVRQVKLNQHYVFEAFDYCDDADHPNDQAHKMIRDLKRAIFAVDDSLRKKIKHLRYSGRNIGVRDDGTKVVTAYIEIDVGFLEDLAAS